MLCQQYIPVSVYKIIFTKTDKNQSFGVEYYTKKDSFLTHWKI